MSISLDNIINGIFLFILVGYSNYLYYIIPNQLENYIYKNYWFQFLVIFSLIYFSVELVDNSNESPLNNFYNSILIFLFYLIFSKSNIFISISILFLLIISLVISKQKTFLENNNEEFSHLEKANEIIIYIILGLLFISLFLYVKNIKNEKGLKKLINIYYK